FEGTRSFPTIAPGKRLCEGGVQPAFIPANERAPQTRPLPWHATLHRLIIRGTKFGGGMPMPMLRSLAVTMLALYALSGAQAQTWRDRPVKFISSQAAGGGTDMMGRLIADQLSARVGQPVVYENRPGGGNVIGTQAAARSAPDGYTFFYATA